MMRHGPVRQDRTVSERETPRSTRGFTMLELLIVMMIGLTLTVLAIPLVQNMSANLNLRGAASSVSGVIQMTRYRAITQGCTYAVVFTAATGNYQLRSTQLATNSCGPTLVDICANGAAAPCPISLTASSTPIPLSADTTLTFSPSGSVTSPQFDPATLTTPLILTYKGRTATIRVTNHGGINVAYTP